MIGLGHDPGGTIPGETSREKQVETLLGAAKANRVEVNQDLYKFVLSSVYRRNDDTISGISTALGSLVANAAKEKMSE